MPFFDSRYPISFPRTSSIADFVNATFVVIDSGNYLLLTRIVDDACTYYTVSEYPSSKVLEPLLACRTFIDGDECKNLLGAILSNIRNADEAKAIEDICAKLNSTIIGV